MIERVTDVSAVLEASALFDAPARVEWAARFLAQPGHHLLVAYVDGQPAGMVTGVELTHPDKGTEMLLYELGVDEAFRRRGIGKALVDALAGLARERGCYGMFVLTERENVAAMQTYRSTGTSAESDHVMLSWEF
ncbi:GNAT family N-acetyltransferase [Allorhizocola rhizosphaerae]|uniref:GNAT family N-acetyltransferase n=1 Tax=Allorhizocola rhizosphaerae TaxID=1872709 RepID=UPI000E3DC4EE|nr:GNAT family N-acetyltransferase [Allorhizocola rhizosphaerae]